MVLFIQILINILKVKYNLKLCDIFVYRHDILMTVENFPIYFLTLLISCMLIFCDEFIFVLVIARFDMIKKIVIRENYF